MSGAPIISGSTKFASPAKIGMMTRKIISEAWTEKSPLKVFGVDDLLARLRQLGPHHLRERAADEQEEERGDRVLDPDHLVVGVDAEVVLPAAGAVARSGPPARSARRSSTCPSSRSRRSRPGRRAARRSGSRSRSASPRRSAKPWSARRPTTRPNAKAAPTIAIQQPAQEVGPSSSCRAAAARPLRLERVLGRGDARRHRRDSSRGSPADPARRDRWSRESRRRFWFFFACAAQRSKAAWSSTTTGARIVAWPSPQSSVQTSVYRPLRVGRHPDVGGEARHRVLLHPELRHPERVDHVLGVELEVVRRALDEVQLARPEALGLRT